jgi:hypothetical protein
MLEYRRVTRSCAQRDWSSVTHAEVVDVHKSRSKILRRFLDATNLDSCYTQRGRMDRARDCASPGSHILDKVNAQIAQSEVLAIEASMTVVEELSERWFIVERTV